MKTKINDIKNIFIICLCIGIIRSILLQDIDIIKTTPKLVDAIQDVISEPVFIGHELSKELFDSGAIFIDARDSIVYSDGHIAGSINIPWENIENFQIEEKVSALSYDTDLVIYCSGGDCTLSIDLGDYLFEDLNFEKVYIFEGGFPLWVENNFPIKKFCLLKNKQDLIDEECIYVE